MSNYNSCSYFALPLPLNVGTTQRSDYSSWSRGQGALGCFTIFTTQATEDLEILDCWGLNIKFLVKKIDHSSRLCCPATTPGLQGHSLLTARSSGAGPGWREGGGVL